MLRRGEEGETAREGDEREVRHARNERGVACVINRSVKVMEEQDVKESTLIKVYEECADEEALSYAKLPHQLPELCYNTG